MARINSRTINIDGEKLKRELVKRSGMLNVTAACISYGLGKSTISDAYIYNKISENTKKLLDSKGIPFNSYKSDVELPVRTNKKNTNPDESYKGYLRIDGDKLRELLVQRTGITTLKDISLELGYHPSYLSSMTNKNVIPKSMVNIIEHTYDICLNEYEYIEPKEEPETVKTVEDTSNVSEPNLTLNDEIKSLKSEVKELQRILKTLGQVNVDILNEIKGLREDWRN